MRFRILVTGVLMAGLLLPSFAGIRGRGKYAGVVLFDRWGTCYLFSGVYLMYVSTHKSTALLRYSGKPVLLNAKDVWQPLNPGDGLIRSFKVIGEPKVNPYHPEARVAVLTLAPASKSTDTGEIQLVIRNSGPTAIRFNDSFGLALFGPKGKSRFSPSDGLSDAWITRSGLKTIEWGKNKEWNIRISENDLVRLDEELPAGKSFSIRISLHLPAGLYNLVCGYGGNIHEFYCKASNLLPITAGQDGTVTFR